MRAGRVDGALTGECAGRDRVAGGRGDKGGVAHAIVHGGNQAEMWRMTMTSMTRSLLGSMLAVLLLACAAWAQGEAFEDKEAYRRRVAEIELLVTVDRDFEGAAMALGELDQAVPRESGIAIGPDVAAIRQRIEAAIVEARRDDDAELEHDVLSAIQKGDEIALEALGSRAARVLLRSFEGDGGTLAREVALKSRLIRLLQLDEPAGWELLKDDPWRLGANFGGDVLDSVARFGLRWRLLPGRPPVPERPEWLDWMARMFEHPTAAETFSVHRTIGAEVLANAVEILDDNDAFTPRLAASVAALLDRCDGYVCLKVIRQMEHSWEPSSQAILERLVADPRSAVRQTAAEQLVQADTSPGLRSRIADADVQVRLRLVDSLGPRQRHRIAWGGRNESRRAVGEWLPQATDDEARGLLATLSQDAEPAVREAVAGLLQKLDPPLAEAVYLRLARDPDVQVRQAMAHVEHPDAQVQATILSTLAGETESRILADVDRRLLESDWQGHADWLIPVLKARLANVQAPLSLSRIPDAIVKSAPARAELTRAVLASGDLRLLTPLVLSVIDERGAYRQGAMIGDWARLGGADLARLLPMLEDVNSEVVWRVADRASVEEVDASVPSAVDPLTRDAGRSLEFRLAVCALALHAPTPARLSTLFELLGDESLGREMDPESHAANLVTSAVRSIPAAGRNAVIREILTRLSLRDGLAKDVASSYVKDSPDAGDVSRLILERWTDDPLMLDRVREALWHLLRAPALLDEHLLARAAHGGFSVAYEAVQITGRLRDPRYLGLLRECLDPHWVQGSIYGGPTEVALEAVEAIQGYMSDEAAAILLDAASTMPNAKVREAALLAVEAIGRYRDALASWQRRTTGSAGREAAIARLVEIARGREQAWELRSEAIRGLGTLQAVDHLPLVIEALLDEDQRVRLAAREALQRLNEWAPPVQQPAASPDEGTSPSDP